MSRSAREELLEVANKERDAHLRASLPPKELSISDRMNEISSRYCHTNRDTELAAHLAAMKASLLTSKEVDKDRQMLFLVGESNAGKSTLIDKAIASDRSFFSFTSAEQERRRPLIRATGPSPFTLRNLSIRLLDACGYPVKSDSKESWVTPLVPDYFLKNRVCFVVIEEAQRTLKLDDKSEQQKVSDFFIGLTDSDLWPVRLIFVGVEPLDTLRDRDEQIWNRSKIMSLGAVPYASFDKVADWAKQIITQHAEMGCNDDLDLGETGKKLVHACDGNMGSMITLIRSSIREALVADRNEVQSVDFAQAYHAATSCTPDENIFEQNTWQRISSGLAKLDVVEEKLPASPKKMKPLKSGDRPR